MRMVSSSSRTRPSRRSAIWRTCNWPRASCTPPSRASSTIPRRACTRCSTILPSRRAVSFISRPGRAWVCRSTKQSWPSDASRSQGECNANPGRGARPQEKDLPAPLCPGAVRDRDRCPARALLSLARRADEAARRHVHPGDQDGDRTDHLLHGIASMEDMKKVGRVGLKAIVYFEVVTTLALVVGLVVANLWQPGAGMNVDPATIDAKAIQQYAAKAHEQSAIDYVTHIIPASVVGAFAEGEILQVLFFSLLFA